MKTLITMVILAIATASYAEPYTQEVDNNISIYVYNQTSTITNVVDLGNGKVRNACWCYGRVVDQYEVCYVLLYSHDNWQTWNVYEIAQTGGLRDLARKFSKLVVMQNKETIAREHDWRRLNASR